MNKEKKLKELIGFILYILGITLASYLLIRYVGQRTVVNGSSMEPLLEDGDNLIVDKISYSVGEPERFDVVVFSYEDEENIYYIKRIIGLPGESIRIDESGSIYINGERLSESYGKEVIKNAGIAANEILLGENEYFVLGDNRNFSKDSREASVGVISRDGIVGRALFRMYPFDKVGKLYISKTE